MDVFSSQQRSRIMARVGSKNTRPEIALRSLLHRMGYRFRLHRRDLPGAPDIVLPGRGAVIFVHGCFWHQHPGCKDAVRPAANRAYWDAKLDRNRARDVANIRKLRRLGWRVMVVWSCQIRPAVMARLARRLRRFLG